jgi:ribosomal protein S18 acetylase RimI-like enzyme
MATSRYRVEPLGRHHNRAVFACGEESLDRYLRQQARQDAERYVAAVFVLIDTESDRVAGYDTLGSMSVEFLALDAALQRKLPRYPLLPAVLLGRLAVDSGYQGQGFGEVLLYDAMKRALTHTGQVASMVIIVDALHDRARSFYERYGFLRFASNPHRLYLPMTTVVQLLQNQDL